MGQALGVFGAVLPGFLDLLQEKDVDFSEIHEITPRMVCVYHVPGGVSNQKLLTSALLS